MTNKIYIKVKKLNDKAILPKYAHEGDAGMDVYSTMDAILAPGKIALINTGIALEIPSGYEIQVRPRSGLALNNSITVLNAPGTIDSGYRGEIGVILINHGGNFISYKSRNENSPISRFKIRNNSINRIRLSL